MSAVPVEASEAERLDAAIMPLVMDLCLARKDGKVGYRQYREMLLAFVNLAVETDRALRKAEAKESAGDQGSAGAHNPTIALPAAAPSTAAGTPPAGPPSGEEASQSPEDVLDTDEPCELSQREQDILDRALRESVEFVDDDDDLDLDNPDREPLEQPAKRGGKPKLTPRQVDQANADYVEARRLNGGKLPKGWVVKKAAELSIATATLYTALAASMSAAMSEKLARNPTASPFKVRRMEGTSY